MTRYITNVVIPAVTSIFLCACSDTGTNHYPRQSGTAGIEKSKPGNKQYCFTRISGNQNRDTLKISMHIENKQVTGEMTDAIFEKDIRRGMLSGHVNERNITATWTYMQEGTIESLQLHFVLGNGQLLMAPLVYDTKSGRQKTDTSALPPIVIPESDCQLSENVQGLTVKGIIVAMTIGKDGCTSILKKENGDSIQITMSRIKLQKNYTTLQIGEMVTVSGDTIHTDQGLIILVNLFNKDN